MNKARPSLDSEDRAALGQAAAWRIRLSRRFVSFSDRRAFRAWLKASPMNAAAMDAIDQSWSLARDAGAHLPRPAQRRKALRPKPAWILAGAATAGLVLVVVSLGTTTAENFTTGPGERRLIELADGSAVYLDVSTSLRARSHLLGREAWLDSGSAEFSVVRNGRPFIARTRQLSAEVLGTRFILADRQAGDLVHLVEGSVRVRSGGDEVVLQPGQGVVLTRAGLQRSVTPPVTAGTMSGPERLEFDEVSLVEALNAFARTTGMTVRVAEGVQAYPVSGAFGSNDLEPFLRSVSDVHPVSWRRVDDVYFVDAR